MRIYISYRRADAVARASRLGDALAARIGADAVFRDIDFLGAGTDFRQQLTNAITHADTILVVIGKDWLRGRDSTTPAILEANDAIHLEIAHALREGKRVIPVLVDGARMPRTADLPGDIATLTHFQAIELRDDRWDSDVQSLLAALGVEPHTRAEPAASGPRSAPAPMRIVVIVTILLLLIAGFGLLFWRPKYGTPGSPDADFLLWTALAIAVIVGLGILGLRWRKTSSDAKEDWLLESPPVLEPPPPPPAPAEAASDKVYVFVSHASEDRELAHAIVGDLEKNRMRCWIAPRDIPAGVRSWAGPIVEAIVRSRVFLVIISASSNGSLEVLREVTLANEEKIPLLPVRIDDSPLSPDFRYFFATAQRVEAVGWPRDQLLTQLRAGVGGLLGTR